MEAAIAYTLLPSPSRSLFPYLLFSSSIPYSLFLSPLPNLPNRSRMHVLRRYPNTPDSELTRKYTILGTTGSVYTIAISNLPSCNWYDYFLYFILFFFDINTSDVNFAFLINFTAQTRQRDTIVSKENKTESKQNLLHVIALTILTGCHILFVLLKILKVSQHEAVLYQVRKSFHLFIFVFTLLFQRALLNAELREI